MDNSSKVFLTKHLENAWHPDRRRRYQAWGMERERRARGYAEAGEAEKEGTGTGVVVLGPGLAPLSML